MITSNRCQKKNWLALVIRRENYSIVKMLMFHNAANKSKKGGAINTRKNDNSYRSTFYRNPFCFNKFVVYISTGRRTDCSINEYGMFLIRKNLILQLLEQRLHSDYRSINVTKLTLVARSMKPELFFRRKRLILHLLR